MVEQVKASWVNLDVDSLAPELKQDYESYKEAYKMAKAEKLAFEEAMIKAAELPKGKKMIFGYNFGKLSVAIVDGEQVQAKAKTSSAPSLADFLKSQGLSGARA